MHLCAQSPQTCPALCDPVDCSLPGSSVHGILQIRILEWVAMPSSRGSSQPGEWTCISYIFCIRGRFFTAEPLGMPHAHHPCFWINGSPLILPPPFPSHCANHSLRGPPVTRFHELGLLSPPFTSVKWLITAPPLSCVNNYCWDFFFFLIIKASHVVKSTASGARLPGHSAGAPTYLRFDLGSKHLPPSVPLILN